MGAVYLVTNLLTHKKYVGKTKGPLHHRWRRHLSNARAGSGTYLCRAIRKYKPENFTVELIGQFPPECLSEAERLFITELGTHAPAGYNLTKGGDGLLGYTPTKETRDKLRRAGLGQKRGPMPEWQKQFISQSNRGRVHTAEFCHRRSEYMKQHNPMLGKTHTAEARQKISAAAKLRHAKGPSCVGMY